MCRNREGAVTVFCRSFSDSRRSCRRSRPCGIVYGFRTAPLAFPIFGCSRRLFGCCAVRCSLHQRQRRVGLSQCRSRTPEIGERAKGSSAVFLLGIQNPFLFARKKKTGFGNGFFFDRRFQRTSRFSADVFTIFCRSFSDNRRSCRRSRPCRAGRRGSQGRPTRRAGRDTKR